MGQDGTHLRWECCLLSSFCPTETAHVQWHQRDSQVVAVWGEGGTLLTTDGHSYHVHHARGVFGPLITNEDLVCVSEMMTRVPDEVLLATYNAVAEHPVRGFSSREDAIRRVTMRLVYRGMTLTCRHEGGANRCYLQRMPGFRDTESRCRWGRPSLLTRRFREGRGRRITEQRWRKRLAESLVWCDVSHCRVELMAERCSHPDAQRPGHRLLWDVLATGVTLQESLVVAERLGAPRYALDPEELLRLLLAAQESGEARLWTEDEVWWERQHGRTPPDWLLPARG